MIEKIIRYFYKEKFCKIEERHLSLKNKIIELTQIIDRQLEDYNVLLNSIDIMV